VKRQAGDIEDCVRADGCPVDVTQWQSTGSSSYVSWVECLATDDLLTSLQNVYAHTPMYCSLFSCKWQQLAEGSLTDGDTIIVTAIVLQVLSLLGQQEVAITSHLHIRV